MQLHYHSVGEGQPLILIHGLFGSADNWRSIAKHFSKEFRVISIDLRNHGRSPHSISQNYAEMASDLITLCDTLNLDNIHLLGHSLGGKVAMKFATQYPQRVNQLIVVDMAIRAYQDTHTHLIDAMLSVDLTIMKSRNEVDQVLSSRIKPAMVRQFLLMNLVKSNGRLAWRINLSALKANYPHLQEAICDITHYTKTCLFIRGDQSDYIQEADISQIKHHFKSAQFASLPTGHWVHAEEPKAFIQLVEKFLSAT